MKERTQVEMFVPAEESKLREDNAWMWGFMIGAAFISFLAIVLFAVSGLLPS